MTRTVIVWGTSSGAGKSLLATALCRVAARRGIDVAPFKAQNMSNNARVVPTVDGDCGEIGSAQYFQAAAARVAACTDHNPVLLKPERDTSSQVVVHGRVDAALSVQPWRERSAALAAAARAGFERLAARHELIVVEGAGSPAEINLAAHDYVNLEVARWARSHGTVAAVLVADIDRGGAFAHLYGTWQLLPDDLRAHLAGHVLNKFRGDAGLLAPGPQRLRELTGAPVLAVLPMVRDHGLPEEDGRYGDADAAPSGAGPHVAIVATPHLSNLDEFQPLAGACALRWARTPQALERADWIILPGSKQVSGDLRWLREQGLADAIVAHARRGGRVLGICGGLQLLGHSLHDPLGVDGEPYEQRRGLGLLPLVTHHAAPKRLRAARAHFDGLHAPWQALDGLTVPGYEIRCGRTESTGSSPAVLHADDGTAIGWQDGPVLGVYAHGLFEAPAVLQALLGVKGRGLDERLDGLADLAEAHFEPHALSRLLDPRSSTITSNR